MPFIFERLSIPEVMLIRPKVFADERGFFLEMYKHSDFSQAGITEHFIQDNFSKSVKNVLRGLHYQKNPAAQGKLIRCIKGKIFDVAVDISKDSQTYGQWVGVELSEEDNHMLYIPMGFAHGFVVLSDEADVLYKCTQEYSPENEQGILWNDPVINIKWPVVEPLLSEKDRRLPLFKDADIIYKAASPPL